MASGAPQLLLLRFTQGAQIESSSLNECSNKSLPQKKQLSELVLQVNVKSVGIINNVCTFPQILQIYFNYCNEESKYQGTALHDQRGNSVSACGRALSPSLSKLTYPLIGFGLRLVLSIYFPLTYSLVNKLSLKLYDNLYNTIPFSIDYYLLSDAKLINSLSRKNEIVKEVRRKCVLSNMNFKLHFVRKL